MTEKSAIRAALIVTVMLVVALAIKSEQEREKITKQETTYVSLDPMMPRNGGFGMEVADIEYLLKEKEILAERASNDPTNIPTYAHTSSSVSSPASQGLTPRGGVYYGKSGKETWYDLPMDGVISIMRSHGYSEAEYPYWIRDDGCKMLGDYIMCAANLEVRPKGTILETSLGRAIVVDTGAFSRDDVTAIDIATSWGE